MREKKMNKQQSQCLLQLLVHTVRVLSFVSKKIPIDLAMRLFQRYHVWDLLLSTECLFVSLSSVSSSPSTNAPSGQDPSSFTTSNSFPQLMLLTSDSEQAKNAAVAVEYRCLILDLFSTMVTKASTDNRIDSLALEIRDMILAIERVATTLPFSDSTRIQLATCLCSLLQHHHGGNMVRQGLTDSHMLPQLV